MTGKPVSVRRYPHERRHNLPAGRQALIERAKQEAREAGVAFDDDLLQVVYDPDERQLVITLFGSD
ncbi:hypothetical protein LCGC14_2135220 [marine sediment metagenome]|uniref:Uncharacterized protein n=1 Tax=marine sediment metagenome TaxID=412755 RepID=A0A0F9GD81_9ZZZZ